MVLTVPPVPTNGDPVARARYIELESQYKQSRRSLQTKFDSLATEYPNDPVVPYAVLFSAMSAVRAGKYDSAINRVDSLQGLTENPGILGRGSLYKGIALNYLGDFENAYGLLRNAEPAVNIEDREEHAEWLAASASSASAVGRSVEAITYYDAWYEIARKSEQRYAISEVKKLVTELPEDQVEEAYKSRKRDDGPAAAYLGNRFANQLVTLGDRGRADDCLLYTSPSPRDLSTSRMPSSA